MGTKGLKSTKKYLIHSPSLGGPNLFLKWRWEWRKKNHKMLILAQFLVFIALNFENLFTKNQHNLTEVLLEKLNWFLIHALKSNFKLCLVVNFLMTYSFFYNISNSKGFFYFNSRKKITQFLRNLTAIPPFILLHMWTSKQWHFSYTFSSNWNLFKRFHSFCLCYEECLIMSFM